MGEPEKPNAGFDGLQLWKEYEGVAMHFNDLIIKLRGQSLGAVAAFSLQSWPRRKRRTKYAGGYWPVRSRSCVCSG